MIQTARPAEFMVTLSAKGMQFTNFQDLTLARIRGRQTLTANPQSLLFYRIPANPTKHVLTEYAQIRQSDVTIIQIVVKMA